MCVLCVCAVCRHLLSCSVVSSTTDSTEDLYLADPIDLPEIGFGEKVNLLEKKLLELQLETVTHGDQQTRLKQHNLQLVHRVHALEEAVRDGEERADERLELEERRCRERTVRAHREADLQVDCVASRVLEAEEENERMKVTIPRLRSQIERLEEETTRLQEKLRELLSRLQEEGRLGQQLAARVRHGRSQFLRDTEETQAVRVVVVVVVVVLVVVVRHGRSQFLRETEETRKR
ncbi:rab11 family-interacting protein 4A-like [Lampetra fluviatilis]